MKCFKGKVDLPIPFYADVEGPVRFTYKGIRLWYTPPTHPWGESVNAMCSVPEPDIFYGSDVIAYLDFKRLCWQLYTEATRNSGFIKREDFRGSAYDALDRLIEAVITKRLKGEIDE